MITFFKLTNDKSFNPYSCSGLHAVLVRVECISEDLKWYKIKVVDAAGLELQKLYNSEKSADIWTKHILELKSVSVEQLTEWGFE